MSLRYALLALLKVGPQSGYELQKKFDSSVGHLWHAPDSQIYPELRRMEQDHLIEGEQQVRGTRGTRRIYHITPVGEEDYRGWMNGPLSYSRVREPASLKAAYLEGAEPDAARAFLTAHIDHWQGELDQWEEELERIDSRSNPMLVSRLAVTPEQDRDRVVAFKRLGYENLVARAQAEITWAQSGLALLDRFSAPE